MPFYTKNNKTIQFMHIPKCAGSSVDKFFVENNFKRNYVSGILNPCSYQHRHLNDQEFINQCKKYNNIVYKFTFVRNPVERIISRFRMVNKIEDNIENLFHDFVIESIEGVNKNKYFKDNHFRHQNEFINEEMKVFKFGEWDDFIKDISMYVEIENKKFPHEFESKSTKFKCLPETIELIKSHYKDDLDFWNKL